MGYSLPDETAQKEKVKNIDLQIPSNEVNSCKLCAFEPKKIGNKYTVCKDEKTYEKRQAGENVYCAVFFHIGQKL